MSALSIRYLKPSMPGKWKQLSWRRSFHWVSVVSLSLILAILFLLALLYHKIQDRLVLFSSPLSPFQQDHPTLQISEYSDVFRRRRKSVFVNDSIIRHNAQYEGKPTNSSRFFRSATAAAAKLGTVLSWNQDTIRLLRGSKVEEIFFLFYDPDHESKNSSSSTSNEGFHSSVSSEEMPQSVLSIFKRVALEDRNEQQTLLPYVAVPKQNMHTLSFFLPDSVISALPAALIVRTDSGWIKYHAPFEALRSVYQMKKFLDAYRLGKVLPTLRTEDIILSDERTPIKQLVASNFISSVVEPTNGDSLVFLYATWCGHCRRFEKNLLELASTFRGIESVKFFKMDVSRNDVPIMGLRVERVPHVLFFVRDPEASENQIAKVSTSELSRFTSLRLEADKGTYAGAGKTRKRVLVFDHSSADIPSYGKAFLLQHAYCKKIDLNLHTDCNTGKDTAEL